MVGLEMSVTREIRKLLLNKGISPDFVTHRIVKKKRRVAHLFKIKEDGKTRRFVAQPIGENPFGRLIEISTTERKWVGRTGRNDVENRIIRRTIKGGTVVIKRRGAKC
jgi:hypothetical protein